MGGLLKLFASWSRDAASNARASRADGRLIFPVVFQAKICCAMVIAVFVPLLLFAGLTHGTPIFGRIFCALFAIFLFRFWPWRVVLDKDGISKRNYIGAGRLMQWSEVTSLVYREKFEDYIVTGRDGTKIRFSPFHVDSAQFEAEVLKNSQVKHAEITDPARGPYSRRRPPLVE